MLKAIGRTIFIFVICFAFSIPTFSFAEQFGEGDGKVGDMFEIENVEQHEDSLIDQDEHVEDRADETTYDSDEESSEVAGIGEQNLFLLSMQMFLALGVVIFLIYGLLKFVNNRSKSFRSHSTIESIGGVGLGANRSIQLVRIGDKLFVVGVGETVQLLKEIEDEDEIEKILEEHKPTEGLEQPIKKLSTWMQKRRGSENQSSESFHSLLDNKLKEVKDSQEKAHSSFKEKDRW
ncbi:flagellar biosynthetic protein FliO [Evansella halocellulosilytica]|uniref:flagellar biosynthetic protein FliO n=1 Tax=Evansella halocellulosilytica TaxID=2011013 RepID=UPI000BB96073|nr:flagellar biosynthetic protein FliO [Evansella halocellulosilytica]